MSSNPTLATAAFKMSSQQERAWLEHEAGIPQIAQCIIALEGEAKVEKLKRALEHTIEKYEILRTVFRKQTGMKLPFQVIENQPAFDWEEVANHDMEERLRREHQSHWDLEHGPTVRALLSSTSGGFRLALMVSPLSADALTLKNLCSQLASYYGAEDQDTDQALQYADLVEWQNEMLASEETKAGREFWREACRGIDFASLGLVGFPQEKSGGAFQADSVTVKASHLPDSIERLAIHLRVSPEDILLTAWATLLGRLTGQPELILGHEFDGRRYQELTGAFGPLARTVPLKLEIRSGLAFAELARKINAATGELLQELTIHPDRGYQPTGAPLGPKPKTARTHYGLAEFGAAVLTDMDLDLRSR